MGSVTIFCQCLLLSWLFTQSHDALAIPSHEVDYMALAVVLIKDGHYNRAQAALAKVNREDKTFDRGRYFLLRGLIHLRLGKYRIARQDLLTAIKGGQRDEVVHLYMAQAMYGLKAYAQVLTEIDRAGMTASNAPAVHMMAAQAHWFIHDSVGAIAVLNQAAGQFPDKPEFQRQKIFFLIELGLFRHAAALGLALVQDQKAAVTDYLAIGRALSKSAQYDAALRLLESARLKFPGNSNILQWLARIYVDKGDLLTAGQLTEQMSGVDPRYLADTAELYRQAGKLYHALVINGRIGDQKKKLKQRLAILLAMGHFDMAAGMEKDLRRLGLLQQEELRYALSYAFFKSGNYAKTEQYLKRLSQNDLFRKAAELRKAMETCRHAVWKCY